jgi:hypothetical protein
VPPFPTKKTNYVDESISRLTDPYKLERPVVVASAVALALETDITNEITTEGGSSLAIE